MRRIHVWDLPTRLFHWLLAAGVVALVITGNIGGNAMVWHLRLGYAVGSLLLFRLLWGFAGGYWSRFAHFTYGARTFIAYLRGQAPREADIGHNPLGALSVYALLAVCIAQVASGLLSDDDIAFHGPLTRFVSESWVSKATEYHTEVGKLLLIGLVCLHIAAIIYHHRVKRHPLVPAMIHGDKVIEDGADIPSSRDDIVQRLLALVLFAVCAAVMAWVASLDR